MAHKTPSDYFVGRDSELRQLRRAIECRSSRLIWGAKDCGKTSLVCNAIAGLSAAFRKRCIAWSGPATGRELVTHFVRELYLAGDSFIRKKVLADGSDEAALNSWLREQSALRLRGILFTAAGQADYRLFLDQFPSVTRSVARLLKGLMNRCKTPVYLTGPGYSAAEIGFAWSLYWTDEYRIAVPPLSEAAARELLESCIRRFGLDSLDLEGFRDDVLRMSALLPGAIVKMCELASNGRYHYRDHIKTKIVHLDYLMHANLTVIPSAQSSLR
jgi:hypothetical protein